MRVPEVMDGAGLLLLREVIMPKTSLPCNVKDTPGDVGCTPEVPQKVRIVHSVDLIRELLVDTAFIKFS